MAFLLGWILLASSGVRAQMTAATRQAIVDGHNAARRSIQTPSMIEIEYDMDLECVAQAYINTQTISTFQHNANRQSQYVACGGPSTASVGENWFSGDPTDASNAWTDMLWGTCSERMDYNGATDANGNVCSGDSGHYTQVTWSSTAKVGCGFTSGGGTVCDYSPAGNYVGQLPYSLGTPCSACPSAYPVCDNGLCNITGSASTSSPVTSTKSSSPVATSTKSSSPVATTKSSSPVATTKSSSPVVTSTKSSSSSTKASSSSTKSSSSSTKTTTSSPKSSPVTPASSPVSCPNGWSWQGNGGAYYTAVKGDTCQSVATKYGLTLAAFQAENSGVVCSCPLMAGQIVNVGSASLLEEGAGSFGEARGTAEEEEETAESFARIYPRILPAVRSRSKARLAFTRAGLEV